MYTDPSGFFSIGECSIATSIQSTLNSVHQMTGLIKGAAIGFMVDGMCKTSLGIVLKPMMAIFGLGSQVDQIQEAIKSGDPAEVAVQFVQLICMLFGLTSQCFTGDTVVSTEIGLRPIEEIQVGDYVWSENIETGEKELKQVADVSVTMTNVLVCVIMEDGITINTTENHPFYVEEKGWCAAAELQAGDICRTKKGKTQGVVSVTIEQQEEPIKVYNLTVDGNHTYYVSEKAVLVHNRCELGENMKNSPDGIGDPGTDYDAHHVFPQKFRDYFEIIGIDVDDPDFGIWIDKHEHRSSAKEYNKKWEEFFGGFESIDDISLDDIFAFISSLEKLW